MLGDRGTKSPDPNKSLTSSYLIHFKWLDLCCYKRKQAHIIERWRGDTLPIAPVKMGAGPELSGLTTGREV